MLQLSSIELTHKLFSGPSEWIPAMNKVKQIVAEANFSNRAFPVGTEYASWETDEVIELEFWRNMGLSLLCVFITTLVLIQNLPACVIVLLTQMGQLEAQMGHLWLKWANLGFKLANLRLKFANSRLNWAKILLKWANSGLKLAYLIPSWPI